MANHLALMRSPNTVPWHLRMHRSQIVGLVAQEPWDVGVVRFVTARLCFCQYQAMKRPARYVYTIIEEGKSTVVQRLATQFPSPIPLYV